MNDNVKREAIPHFANKLLHAEILTLREENKKLTERLDKADTIWRCLLNDLSNIHIRTCKYSDQYDSNSPLKENS